eukprot:9231971-Pyramimonas_sp.AAC.1
MVYNSGCKPLPRVRVLSWLVSPLSLSKLVYPLCCQFAHPLPASSAVLASVSIATALATEPAACVAGSTPVPPWAAWEDPGYALKCDR